VGVALQKKKPLATEIVAFAGTTASLLFSPSFASTLRIFHPRAARPAALGRAPFLLITFNHTPSRSYAKAKKAKMPPKKAAVEEKIPLGRPGNNLKSGIVGLANVGKSTLFQAITKSNLGNPAV
jgi:hypothetical protein